MLPGDNIIGQWRVPQGKPIHLKDFDPNWSGDGSLPKSEREKNAETVLSQDVSKPAEGSRFALRRKSLVDLDYTCRQWMPPVRTARLNT